MSDSDDPLGSELAVSAQLDDKGFSAKAKSRTLAALDRLCGNLIDIPGAHIERIATRTRAETDGLKKLIAVDSEVAAHRLAESPFAGDRALQTFAREQWRKQTNRDCVAVEALTELKALPPPEDVDEQEDLDGDWLCQFVRHSEDASTERVQKLWGRILAGEIRKPGSFSLSTLRLLAELDRPIAEDFEEMSKFVVQDAVYRGRGEDGGPFVARARRLMEHGLLSGADGTLSRSFEFPPNGILRIIGTNFAVHAEGDPPVKRDPFAMDASVMPLTRIGRELLRLLPYPQYEESELRKLAKLVKGAKKIALGRIIRNPGGYSFTEIEQLPLE